jgi:cyclopropane-fatty-acyl-phospholipid synthase
VLHPLIENAGLEFARSIEFAESYSQTLRRWHADFNERWDEISALGFDDRFRRMWNMYLTSCASAFQTRNCDVTQITVRRPA